MKKVDNFDTSKWLVENKTQDQIQQYIKKGRRGDLRLEFSKVTSLPDNLKKVERDLYLFRLS
jgi:hypothetical protein